LGPSEILWGAQYRVMLFLQPTNMYGLFLCDDCVPFESESTLTLKYVLAFHSLCAPLPRIGLVLVLITTSSTNSHPPHHTTPHHQTHAHTAHHTLHHTSATPQATSSPSLLHASEPSLSPAFSLDYIAKPSTCPRHQLVPQQRNGF
jgi:hypothetical protein